MPIPPEILREHVLLALADLDGGVDHTFGEPTRYWLLHEGRRYPPKAAIGLASKYATGAALIPEDFYGGEGAGQTNDILRGLGFEIEPFSATPGDDWGDSEVDLVVADYFSMLRAELLGEEYSKSEHRKKIQQQLSTRSKGSIEFKHANMSAVLADMGYPTIDGYKPRGNYQMLLRDRVEAFLEAHPDVLQDTIGGPKTNPMAAARPESSRDVFVPVPKSALPAAVATTSQRRGRRIDFAKIDADNRSLGRKGEEYVLQLERMRLAEEGRPDLAAAVEWTSEVRGDGLGYDIKSFEVDGSERFVEVKTTGLGELTPFYVSAGEIRCSEDLAERYHLYRVYFFGGTTKVFILKGPLRSTCALVPVSYMARPKAEGF